MIVCIIPARGGSKGISNKNLALLRGKPLLAWTIERALACKRIETVVVSTESCAISQFARSCGAGCVARPESLAEDDVSSEEALKHALTKGFVNYGKIEAVVFLQATSPLRKPHDIDAALDCFIGWKADSLFSATPFSRFLWRREWDGRLRPLNYRPEKRPRRQDHEPDLIENGSIYIFKPKVLLETGCRLGGKVVPYVMEESLEIDTLEDLAEAERRIDAYFC